MTTVWWFGLLEQRNGKKFMGVWQIIPVESTGEPEGVASLEPSQVCEMMPFLRHAGTHEFIRIHVQLPETAGGEVLVAAVRRWGVTVAAGAARLEGGKTGIVDLFILDGFSKDVLTHGNLWLCVNGDDRISWFPSAGDRFWTGLFQPSEIPADWRTKNAPEGGFVRIRYHRFDLHYAEVSLWTWDPYRLRAPDGAEIFPAGMDDFGVVFEVDSVAYGERNETAQIGCLVRFDGNWTHKDGRDKLLEIQAGGAVWLIGGRQGVYYERPSIAPQIVHAFHESRRGILVEFSHGIGDDQLDPGRVQLLDASGRGVGVEALQREDGDPRRALVWTAVDLPVGTGDFTILHNDFEGTAIVEPRGVLDDPEWFAEKEPQLGAVGSPSGMWFRVFAPTATGVWLVLYDHAAGTDGRTEVSMARASGGVFECHVDGVPEGKFYRFRLEGGGTDASVEVTDPYAVNAVDSGRRARITHLAATNPPGWNGDTFVNGTANPTDAVIYELHVRDFSMDPRSGIRNKGLYLGFTEEGTHLTDDPATATGLAHLKELGVTHVQLLPVQDFDNDESARAYHWGYMTSYFNSPEGIYATDPNNETRIRELKEAVLALHSAGIGVVLDVVYNHTGFDAPFDQIVPGYYYRHEPDGSRANGSGCGNEFRTEGPMVRRFVIETLCHWTREFHIDGFRFDLMALMDMETMREIESRLRIINPQILLYGEPWQAAPSPVHEPAEKWRLAGTGIGAFNDDYRDALKGSPNGSEAAFIQRGWNRDKIENGMEGSRRLWAPSPGQSINYMTCHDNLVLWDKLLISDPDATPGQRHAMIKLGYFILLTSQGVPFLHAGGEFGRTKGGDHNSYQSPDSVNRIDWSLKASHRPLFNYVQALIALRKAHPVFRLRDHAEIERRMHFHYAPTGDTIAATIDGTYLEGEEWVAVCLLVNGHPADAREFELPRGRWRVVFDENGRTTSHQLETTATLCGRRGIVLARGD